VFTVLLRYGLEAFLPGIYKCVVPYRYSERPQRTSRGLISMMHEPNEFEPDEFDREDEELDENDMRERIQREAEEIRDDEEGFEDELPEQEPGTVGGPKHSRGTDDPVDEMLR
jgi:hypothetical protein